MICTFLFILFFKLMLPHSRILCVALRYFFNFKTMKRDSNNHLYKLNLVYVEGAQTSVCPPSFFIAKTNKPKKDQHPQLSYLTICSMV